MKNKFNRNNVKNKKNQMDALLQEHLPKTQIITHGTSPKKYIVYNGREIPLEFQTIVTEHDFSDDVRKYLLLLVGILRLYYVDKLVDLITEYYYKCKQLEGFDLKCNVVAVGSTAPTSNYDVTVSGVLFPQKIVTMFNKTFLDFWGDYSSVVFDTNLYGSTFFVTAPAGYEVPRHISQMYNYVLTTSGQSVYYLPPSRVLQSTEMMKNIYKSQLEWLPIKYLFHAHEYGFMDMPIYNKYNSSLMELLKKLLDIPENPNAETLIQTKGILHPQELTSGEHLERKVEMYERTQEEVKERLTEYETIGMSASFPQAVLVDKLYELIETISRNNYYGMETYYCMGTIYHILGFIQNLAPFQMHPSYFQLSAIENFIDLFRYAGYFNSFGSGEQRVAAQVVNSPATFEKALIKMSKYVYRIYDALSRLSPGNSNIESVKATWKFILDRFKGGDAILNQPNRSRNNIMASIGVQTSTATPIELVLDRIWEHISEKMRVNESIINERKSI